MDFALSPRAEEVSARMWGSCGRRYSPRRRSRSSGGRATTRMGVSDDTPLAYFYAWARSLRIVDGPDAVHRRSITREELNRERPFAG